MRERPYMLVKYYNHPQMWRGRQLRAVDPDGFAYWIIVNGTVINRMLIKDASWDS